MPILTVRAGFRLDVATSEHSPERPPEQRALVHRDQRASGRADGPDPFDQEPASGEHEIIMAAGTMNRAPPEPLYSVEQPHADWCPGGIRTSMMPTSGRGMQTYDASASSSTTGTGSREASST